MHLFLRADGTAEIGVGHLMRGLALVEGWVARGGSATLLGTAPPPIAERFRQTGAEVIDVPWASEPDAEDVLGLPSVSSRGGAGAWFVVDGYRFDHRYSAALRGMGASVAVVDDTAENDAYDCDLLINQNLGAERLAYRINPDAEMLRGAKFAMLRREFRDRRWPARVHPDVADRVLVTMGGGDPDNVAARVVAALSRPETAHVHARVVIGQANIAGRAAIMALPFDRARIELVDNADMPAQMEWASMAVSAAGSTAWEAAFTGLPTVLIVVAANQEGVARELHRHGAAVSLGPATSLSVDDIAAAVAELSADRADRIGMAARAEALIDGGGVDRVIDRCIARPLQVHGLHLRRVEVSDRRPLFELANDADVRRNAFHPEPIVWDAHCAWFERRLASRETWLEVATDPSVAGASLAAQIRYDRLDADVAEIDFAVAPARRGQGLGAALLSDSVARAYAGLRVAAARGVVFADNVASASAFRRAGFVVAARDIRGGRDCVVFERRVSGRMHS